MNTFIELVKSKVNDLRKVKQNLSFLQIGAYDGVSFNDMANLTLSTTDNGFFIEPNDRVFEILKNNKTEFKESTFLKIAIIPNNQFESDVFYVDQYGGQSTFVKNVFNERIHITNRVETITVQELFSTTIKRNLDICFLDCEGYDHDIIKELLKYQNPEIIYFESWNTVDLNNQLGENKFTTREEIISILKQYGYNTEFEPIEANILAYKA
jgi:FkbM family methyltransferase